MSTIKVTNVQNPSAASAAITLDANGQATLNGLAYPTSGSLSGRNRIINGDMRIDQRNAGASVTPTNSPVVFPVDRFPVLVSQNSKLTAQRNAGSVTPPAGFTNYLGITSSSAYSLAASDYFFIAHRIEGYNVADLAWGTANAKAITLSFWVRCSLTGTFGGALRNDTAGRSYPFSYTISSANTWEYKSITVPGDTTGTWETATAIGFDVDISVGAGSTYSGTAGAWAGSNYVSATGTTSVVGTNGATFYITGVQLEAGSVATPFERRSYGQELALCQRYFEKSYDTDVAPGSVNSNGYATNGGLTGMATASYATRGNAEFKVTKRAQPTITTYDLSGNSGKCNFPDNSTNVTMTVIHRGFQGYSAETAAVTNNDTRAYWQWTASAEL